MKNSAWRPLRGKPSTTKPKFQSCWSRRPRTTDSTRSSLTNSPACIVRRIWAPSLVWFWTCQRKMSPTLMCTMSRSPQSIALWVPLPLPWTPIITYFCMCLPSVGGADAQRARGGPPGERGGIDAPGAGHPQHIVLGDQDDGLRVHDLRKSGGALGRIRVAVPEGDVAGLPHVAERSDQFAVRRALPAMQLGDPVRGEELDLGVQPCGQLGDVDGDVRTQQPAAGREHPRCLPGARQRRRQRDSVVGEVRDVDALAPRHVAEIAQAQRVEHRRGVAVADGQPRLLAAETDHRVRIHTLHANRRTRRAVRSRSVLTPAVLRPQLRGHPVEAGAVEDRALAADAVLVDLEDAVEPDPARPGLAIPRSRAEREPAALAVPLTL